MTPTGCPTKLQILTIFYTFPNIHAAQYLPHQESQYTNQIVVEGIQQILGHPGTIGGRPRRCLKFILFHGEFGQIYERSDCARL